MRDCRGRAGTRRGMGSWQSRQGRGVVVGSRLGIEVEALDERVGVAYVRGEIDMSTTSALLERLLPAAESGPPGLVVDLSDVGFMGAAGIHALEEVKASLARRGGKLAVVAPGGIPLRVLEVTGTRRTFGVVPTLDAARIALGARS